MEVIGSLVNLPGQAEICKLIAPENGPPQLGQLARLDSRTTVFWRGYSTTSALAGYVLLLTCKRLASSSGVTSVYSLFDCRHPSGITPGTSGCAQKRTSVCRKIIILVQYKVRYSIVHGLLIREYMYVSKIHTTVPLLLHDDAVSLELIVSTLGHCLPCATNFSCYLVV